MKSLKRARNLWARTEYSEAYREYLALKSKGIPEANLELALLVCQMPNVVGQPGNTREVEEAVICALMTAADSSREFFKDLYTLVNNNNRAFGHADNYLPRISQSICEFFSRKTIDDVVYYYLLENGHEQNPNSGIVALVDAMCAQGRIPADLKTETVLAIAAAIEATLQGRSAGAVGSMPGTPELPLLHEKILPPSAAPALWDVAREGKETPIEFIGRHYQPWIGKGLTRPDIKRLDPKLYAALTVWLHRHPGDAESLNLPTKAEDTTRRLVQAFATGNAEVALSAPTDERQRLRSGLRYRVGGSAPETGWRDQIAAERGQVAPTAGIPLPQAAPALWRGRKVENMTPPEFIVKHYRPWLGNGLTRANILSLDPKLYKDLENFLSPRNNRRGKKVIPPEFDLPTLPESNDRWVERIADGADTAVSGGQSLSEKARERAREASVLRRRAGSDSRKK
jgi:hypothetical protein